MDVGCHVDVSRPVHGIIHDVVIVVRLEPSAGREAPSLIRVTVASRHDHVAVTHSIVKTHVIGVERLENLEIFTRKVPPLSRAAMASGHSDVAGGRWRQAGVVLEARAVMSSPDGLTARAITCVVARMVTHVVTWCRIVTTVVTLTVTTLVEKVVAAMVA